MPTYGYQCPEGHTFERFQKMTASTRSKCPTCGKQARRLISGGAGIVFKGSGFYITDYKRAEEKRSEKSPKPEAGKKESSGKKKKGKKDKEKS